MNLFGEVVDLVMDEVEDAAKGTPFEDVVDLIDDVFELFTE